MKKENILLNILFYILYSFKNNLTRTCYMFYDCSSLINLDLSNFNTQNVNDMSFMFSFCNSLISLDLSNFNTQNVTDMDYMFDGCESLKKENIITKDDKILKILTKQ